MLKMPMEPMKMFKIDNQKRREMEEDKNPARKRLGLWVDGLKMALRVKQPKMTAVPDNAIHTILGLMKMTKSRRGPRERP